MLKPSLGTTRLALRFHSIDNRDFRGNQDFGDNQDLGHNKTPSKSDGVPDGFIS